MLKTIKLIAINLGILIYIFLFLEIAVRTYAHIFIDGESFFRNSTFISPWITAYDYPTPIINENGLGIFRHQQEPVPIEKADNTIRIIAVGGSTTLNQRSYARAGIDYAMVLEKLLNESISSKTRFEVLNAGSDAYSSAHSLVNIQFRLVEFNPDMILLMHNINDLSVNYFGHGSTSDYTNKYMQPFYINPELQAAHSFIGFLLQSRLLAKLGLFEYVALKRSVDYSNSIENGSRYFYRNLEYISTICSKNGIKLVLLTQPNNMNGNNSNAQKEQFLTYNQIIRDVANREDAILIDMFNLFGHGDQYFVDMVHYSPEGINRFADLLHKQLTPELLM